MYQKYAYKLENNPIIATSCIITLIHEKIMNQKFSMISLSSFYDKFSIDHSKISVMIKNCCMLPSQENFFIERTSSQQLCTNMCLNFGFELVFIFVKNYGHVLQNCC